VEPPKQAIEPAEEEAVSWLGWVTVTEAVAVQPLASVTVKVYVPAVRVKLPVPVYGDVPPVALTVTVVEPPKHAIGFELAVTFTGSGPVIITELEVEHPFISVIVTV
jgi:hypothetical protein